MTHSRKSPSRRYVELIDQYKEMHTASSFLGLGPFKHRKPLRVLIRETGSTTLLDYGCADAQYLDKTDPKALLKKLGVFCSSWTEALGVTAIAGYDPAVKEYATLPKKKFDGVISIDCLEHIFEDDLPWVIDEIFSFATKFVFLTVAVAPAKKNLPNGENAHVTLKNVEWWLGLVDGIAKKYSKIRYEVIFDEGTPKDHE